jgi:hypothetical protein
VGNHFVCLIFIVPVLVFMFVFAQTVCHK